MTPLDSRDTWVRFNLISVLRQFKFLNDDLVVWERVSPWYGEGSDGVVARHVKFGNRND